MKKQPLDKLLEAARQRLEALRKHAVPAAGQPEWMASIWTELRASMEELYVASEDLRQQYDELIATRQQVEERIHQSEGKYCDLFSEMLLGASIQELICDEQGAPIDYITLDVNKSFERLLNARKEDVIGKRASAFLPQEELNKWLEIFGTVALTGEHKHYKQFSASNSKYFEGVAFSPKRGQFAVTFEDITERELAEEALLRSQAELEAIYENAPTMMCVLNASRQVLYANRAFAEFVGRPVEEIKLERACGVIGCLRALDDPRGCGHGSRCETCTVRLAMVDALATGRSHHGIEYRTTALCHGQPRDTVFLASIAPIQISGQPNLLLCLEDITERQRAEDELHASREQLRALAAHLHAVREEERTDISREIHDVLAQELTRLKIDLVWLQHRLATPGKLTSSEALAARVTEMSQMADSLILSVQRIATGLRPAVLDSLGLCAAVEWQARDFQEHTGIQCRANVPEADIPVDREDATAAFRILQESLTNVVRHAKATRVDIHLRKEANQLVLRVQDDGCGIPSEALSSPMSIGLAGMQERALLLGVQFNIWSQPGSGTTIEVRLPVLYTENLPERLS